MPDQAKLVKAREIGLRVAKCCGNCINRSASPGGVHGFCKLHSYMHQKHRKERMMPAFRYFVCDDHALDEEKAQEEAGWYAGEEWRR